RIAMERGGDGGLNIRRCFRRAEWELERIARRAWSCSFYLAVDRQGYCTLRHYKNISLRLGLCGLDPIMSSKPPKVAMKNSMCRVSALRSFRVHSQVQSRRLFQQLQAFTYLTAPTLLERRFIANHQRERCSPRARAHFLIRGQFAAMAGCEGDGGKFMRRTKL